jgi:hypothetical protein
MAITRQSDRRESNRRKGDTKIIKIEEEGGKEQEMTIRQAVPKKKARSVWSGHEEFTREWSETFITKKREKHPRKGE